MFAIDFNGRRLNVESTEHLGALLDQFDETPLFELWALFTNGPSLCMVRNNDEAFLMYLRHEGDSGFSSRSSTSRTGNAAFKLANGQDDDYPLSWCIDVEQCYKAVAYFYENAGAKPDWVKWHED